MRADEREMAAKHSAKLGWGKMDKPQRTFLGHLANLNMEYMLDAAIQY